MYKGSSRQQKRGTRNILKVFEVFLGIMAKNNTNNKGKKNLIINYILIDGTTKYNQYVIRFGF